MESRRRRYSSLASFRLSCLTGVSKEESSLKGSWSRTQLEYLISSSPPSLLLESSPPFVLSGPLLESKQSSHQPASFQKGRSLSPARTIHLLLFFLFLLFLFLLLLCAHVHHNLAIQILASLPSQRASEMMDNNSVHPLALVSTSAMPALWWLISNLILSPTFPFSFLSRLYNVNLASSFVLMVVFSGQPRVNLLLGKNLHPCKPGCQKDVPTDCMLS